MAKGAASGAAAGGRSNSAAAWVKVCALTALLFALLSFNYAGLTTSASVTGKPLQLALVALADTLVLGYFVALSRWNGWKEWGACFSVFYGVNYVLTAMEAVYIPSVLPADTIAALLVDGAVVSGVFAAALVLLLSERGAQTRAAAGRLAMPASEWAWKVVCSGLSYLALFFLFGVAVYDPIAYMLAPAALAAEQGAIPPSAAALVLTTEMVRGMLWTLLAVPAVLALPFGWRKTGAMLGLLFAIPVSGSIFLSTAIAPGLIPAHLAEVLAENLTFGVLVAWVLQLRARLPLSSR